MMDRQIQNVYVKHEKISIIKVHTLLYWEKNLKFYYYWEVIKKYYITKKKKENLLKK